MYINNAIKNQTLCFNLIRAESEAKVIEILKEAEYWDNDAYWLPFGDNENNWSTIGNQQASAIAALVEKFVNSIDAVLMRECYLNKINPESADAPQSMAEALEKFFNIPKGNLANLTSSERSHLAHMIGFVATGKKQTPNYIIFDKGEGQTPNQMPHTLLSLAKSNKLRIPFVQGKFNMGGTGALPFCGKNNLQLIISKRHPDIAQMTNADDPTKDSWGFTIVRREEPTDNRKSSMFTYLAIDKRILTFNTKRFTFPKFHNNQTLLGLDWGTIIKLYEYNLEGYKTNIKLDPYYHLSLMFYRPGIPIRFYELRDYEGANQEINLNGLHVRLEDDKKDNLESGFPTSHKLNVNGEKFSASIFAFKKSEHYKKKEGIIFVVNGQTHAVEHERFFSNKSVGMDYIANSILVVVDCSEISGRAREDLFLNSRDRIRKGDLYKELEEQLEDLIRNHTGLRELREKRKREMIQNKLADNKPLKDVLEKVIQKSQVLTSLFIIGKDLSNPFKMQWVGEQKDFNGKKYPTFFNIMEKDKHKQCYIDQRFRVQFETDVENEYFDRDKDQGEFNLYLNNEPVKTFTVNLWNGIANLNIKLPDDVSQGDILSYTVEVQDNSRIEPFVNEFTREVVGPAPKSDGSIGDRKPPAGNQGNNRQNPSKFGLPNIIDVSKMEWENYGFDALSAVKIIENGENSYDFYVNIDNKYLLHELKSKNDDHIELLKAQFRFGLVLFAMAIIKEEPDISTDDSDDVATKVFKLTRSLAPIILPMINSLGDLEIN